MAFPPNTFSLSTSDSPGIALITSTVLGQVATEGETPAAFLERMNFLAIAIVGRRQTGNDFAKTNVLAIIFVDFDVSTAGVGHFVDETERPIMGIAVYVHIAPSGDNSGLLYAKNLDPSLRSG